MIRIAIVDDEKDILNYLSDKIKASLEKLKFNTNVDVFLESKKMLEQNRVCNYDIIFLDLEMPEPDGIQTAEIIREEYNNIIIVIITNRDDLVFNTFQYDVSAFIRKKYFEAEIEEVIKRVYRKAKNKRSGYILKSDKGEKFFGINDIVYIESENHNVYLYNKSGDKIKIFYTLDKLSSILSEEIFIRCHSGIIVSCQHIFSINNDNIELINNISVPLSRSRRKEVKSKFQRFMRSV